MLSLNTINCPFVGNAGIENSLIIEKRIEERSAPDALRAVGIRIFKPTRCAHLLRDQLEQAIDSGGRDRLYSRKTAGRFFLPANVDWDER